MRIMKFFPSVKTDALEKYDRRGYLCASGGKPFFRFIRLMPGTEDSGEISYRLKRHRRIGGMTSRMVNSLKS
jgi:hypothetical protein